MHKKILWILALMILSNIALAQQATTTSISLSTTSAAFGTLASNIIITTTSTYDTGAPVVGGTVSCTVTGPGGTTPTSVLTNNSGQISFGTGTALPVGSYGVVCTLLSIDPPYPGSSEGNSAFTITGNSCSAKNAASVVYNGSPVLINWSLLATLDPAPDDPPPPATRSGTSFGQVTAYVDCNGNPLSYPTPYPPTLTDNGYKPNGTNGIIYMWTITSYSAIAGPPCTSGSCSGTGYTALSTPSEIPAMWTYTADCADDD